MRNRNIIARFTTGRSTLFAGHMYAPKRIKLVDVPDQSLEGDGEILFQPELACLCGSDLLYFEGDYHEHMPKI
ncbi:MAG TPA: hypothetical protein P5307_00770, partial [Pirellulaceae bacterium]|nr:hypothetical protein [Pirellulaceae bacterium]